LGEWVQAPDENWQKRFEDLAREAVCVIALPSTSSWLAWEFEQLRKWGWQKKLFVFTRPDITPKARTAGEKAKRVLTYIATARSTVRAVRRPKPLDWTAFATLLNDKGYKVDSRDPGPGTVIAFEEGGRSVIVRSGARASSEYLDAVEQRLGQQTRSLK
jgi:hypothetical protein